MVQKRDLSRALNKRLGFEEDEVDWTKLKQEDLNKIAGVLLDNRKMTRIAIEGRFVDIQKLGILDMEKGIIARLLLGE